MTLDFNGQVLSFSHINIICGQEQQARRLLSALFSTCSNPEMYLWGTYKSVEFVNSEMSRGRQWFGQLLIDGLEYKRETQADIKSACLSIKKIADSGVDVFVSVSSMSALAELYELVDPVVTILTIVGETVHQLL